jgi:hypothetical protein
MNLRIASIDGREVTLWVMNRRAILREARLLCSRKLPPMPSAGAAANGQQQKSPQFIYIATGRLVEFVTDAGADCLDLGAPKIVGEERRTWRSDRKPESIRSPEAVEKILGT